MVFYKFFFSYYSMKFPHFTLFCVVFNFLHDFILCPDIDRERETMYEKNSFCGKKCQFISTIFFSRVYEKTGRKKMKILSYITGLK